ncbi:hypothetical protein [Anaerovibrio sp.]|uniref:hypothetical protein n=1 Tax=Anaerovibrio sp. TaxID=1872532 RepID=UPI003F17BF69
MEKSALYNFFVEKKAEIYPLLKILVSKAVNMLPEGNGKNYFQENTDFFADLLYRCVLEQSVQCVYSSSRDLAEEELRSAVRKWLMENFTYGDDEFRSIIIDKFENIAVEIVVLFHSGQNEEQIRQLAIATGKLTAKQMAEDALTVLDKRLPDFHSKEEIMAEISFLAEQGIDNNGDIEYMEAVIKRRAVGKACSIANKQINKAIELVIDEMPDNPHKEYVKNLLQSAVDESFEELRQADSIEDAGKIVTKVVGRYAKQEAEMQIKQQGRQALDRAGELLIDRLCQRGRGKGNTKYNKQLKNNVKQGVAVAQENLCSNIEALFSGEKDFGQAVTDMAKGTAVDYAAGQVEARTAGIVGQGAKYAASKLHITGKGSRKINRNIDNVFGAVAAGATESLVVNVTGVIKGEKDAGEAVKSVAVDAGSLAAKDYMAKHGDKIVREVVAELTKQAEKRIANEMVRRTAVTALTKVGNANAVMNVAGAAYDIGKSIKRFMDGEITQAELMREIGEKGTSAVVSAAFAMVGTAVGGPIGAAVGSLAGYLATNLLYGSVLSAFDAADRAKAEYYQVAAACDEAIRLMRQKREQFERETQALFAHRERVFKDSFDKLEQSVRTNDMDAFAASMNNIAAAFGKELQFQNFDEFDKFMMDEDSVFKL